MKFNSKSDKEIIRAIGARLKSLRLASNISQALLAERCGLSRTSIVEIEKGKSCTVATLIIILRQLGGLNLLHDLLQHDEPKLTPMQLYRIEKSKRKRASKSQ